MTKHNHHKEAAHHHDRAAHHHKQAQAHHEAIKKNNHPLRNKQAKEQTNEKNSRLRNIPSIMTND